MKPYYYKFLSFTNPVPGLLSETRESRLSYLFDRLIYFYSEYIINVLLVKQFRDKIMPFFDTVFNKGYRSWKDTLSSTLHFLSTKIFNSLSALKLKLIDSFNHFQLKAEQIQNTSSDVDILQWHYDNCNEDENLQVLYDACAKVALVVQPSSGASERAVGLQINMSVEGCEEKKKERRKKEGRSTGAGR